MATPTFFKEVVMYNIDQHRKSDGQTNFPFMTEPIVPRPPFKLWDYVPYAVVGAVIILLFATAF